MPCMPVPPLAHGLSGLAWLAHAAQFTLLASTPS